MPQQTTSPLPGAARPRHLLGGKLQDSFNPGSPGDIDQFIDRHAGLLDQIHHGQ
jgi:hypothetical protein